MKYAPLSDNTSALRLEPSDDVHDTLQKFCTQQHITNAQVSGIGSVEPPTRCPWKSAVTAKFTSP